ncbi:hypothetical protein Nepgr_032167 [Nepenthes gracilis]|uniref:Nucleolar protein 12 n=1 Tax=Nepenthes gracilis TaxID=150966 RepID=A0AAD3TJG6_NEPGR|nr:hypothetical protein Nepgr_032167 [Nepenthes gracilis]
MEADVEAAQASGIRARHIKKRALRNKALSVTFSGKDLMDFVSGFHKRKKKRRKEARQKQEEADRRKRIEERKKRRLERDYALYGGAPPATGAESDCQDHELDEECEPIPSVSGTMMYDNGSIKVTVTTSEIITREEEKHRDDKSAIAATGTSRQAAEKRIVSVRKEKSFKKVSKQRRRPKLRSKRDRKRGKNNKNRS